MDGGHIALQRAVGLHRHKAPLGAQTAALGMDDLSMLRIDLRDDHGHIRGAPVCAVVGHHRHFGLGIGLLQRPDLFLLHVHGTKDEIYFRLHAFHILGVFHDDIPHIGRHRGIHKPPAFHRLGIGLSRAAARGGNSGYMEPRMIFQQCGKALAHHTGAAYNAHPIAFIHSRSTPLLHLG